MLEQLIKNTLANHKTRLIRFSRESTSKTLRTYAVTWEQSEELKSPDNFFAVANFVSNEKRKKGSPSDNAIKDLVALIDKHNSAYATLCESNELLSLFEALLTNEFNAGRYASTVAAAKATGKPAGRSQSLGDGCY
jgi:hypothetical protein